MRLMVPNEGRFVQGPDGTIWTRGSTSYAFWKRYLDVFDEVQILARVDRVQSIPSEGLDRVDGPGVTCYPLPYYQGPRQYLRQRRRFLHALRSAAAQDGAVILRVYGQVGSAFKSILPEGRPYGVEVIGDARDVFAKGAVQHPLRPFFRWWFDRQTRSVVHNAAGVSYVTARRLQQRYPAAPGVYTTNYSSINLSDTYLLDAPRPASQFTAPIRCITVGSLENMHKGTDVLLRSIAQCRSRGIDLSLTVVGDGKHRQDLENLAHDLRVDDAVEFAGRLSSDGVRDRLDASHLFLLPSRTEGLPRAMIEAMARGLPCIGTDVGGIPELLGKEYLVPADDSTELATRISETVTDPERMARASARNLRIAREYRSEVLRARRNDFYRHIEERTEAWTERTVDGRGGR